MNIFATMSRLTWLFVTVTTILLNVPMLLGAHRERNVAFQVVRKEPIRGELDDILKFDEVATNIGMHYNVHTGEFTAPVPGIYVFYLQVVASDGTFLKVSIQKTASASKYTHYREVVTAVSDKMGPDKTLGGQGTASAVLRLRRGQRVTTIIKWISGKKEIDGGRTTSFSGYLLH